MKRWITVLAVLAAVGSGACAQRPSPSSGPVLVAQSPNDLRDKPAPGTAQPEPTSKPAPAAPQKAQPTFGQVLMSVFQAWVFWATLISMLVVGYAIALTISQLAYRHGQPDTAIRAARNGLGWGMLGAAIVPAIYVLLPIDSLWKPTWPWLWAALLFLPCFVISMFAFAGNDR